MTVKGILQEAEKLSRPEQAELLDALLWIMNDESGADVALTPAQRKDLERRIQEVESGKAELIDGEEAFKQLRART
jgi:putative addiction module component (TIGR02574 family)